jgi:hypothetical protein
MSSGGIRQPHHQLTIQCRKWHRCHAQPGRTEGHMSGAVVPKSGTTGGRSRRWIDELGRAQLAPFRIWNWAGSPRHQCTTAIPLIWPGGKLATSPTVSTSQLAPFQRATFRVSTTPSPYERLNRQ